ncbi:galectin-4-like isoform X2 [Bacillus rossius redtenbacheri]|uniref:galectin-4-like isoform X2 n=1 Tax=Bacillus rossius redtenbacheri TaxID=93214 RepID=UPI002FDD2598
MMTPLHNVSVPYIGPIPSGLTPGKMIRIRGTIPPSANRFAVNLQCGPKIAPRDDIALHLSPKFAENVVARSSLHGLTWGPDETVGHMPLARGQGFELLILCDPAHYKIAINGQHYTEFIHRIPYQRVNHISIDGDVVVNELHFDGNVPPPPPVGFTPYPPNSAPFTANPSPFPNNPVPYPSNQSPYPSNPNPYPAGATPYPTSFPANPSPYPTNPAPYPPVVGTPYGHTPYPTQVQGHGYPGYPGYPGYNPSHQPGYHTSPANKGLVGKAGAVLSGVMGAAAGKKAYKSHKKASKALKYGVPLAGVAGLGLGAYALSKGFHSGSSSSSSSSSSSEEE